ncbi:MAG: hypothetical protein ACOYK8_00965 [Alphaproteobacteria bacterium]
MKKASLFYTLATLAFFTHAMLPAWGSGGPPPAFFAPPNYLDPDYTAPEYTDVFYGPHTKFNMMLLDSLPALGKEISLDANIMGTEKTVPAQSSEITEEAAARKAASQQDAVKFQRYQQGADLFHQGNYDEAHAIFAELSQKLSVKERLLRWFVPPLREWVREASLYMVARTLLVKAQKNWDGYDEPLKNVDQALLQQAEAAYDAYIQQYPHGFFADSARNIKRKIYVLSARPEALNNALKELIAQQQTNDALNEFFLHFTGEADVSRDHPFIIARQWLDKHIPTELELKQLEKRQAEFSPYPQLYLYLRSLALYRLQHYQLLVDSTPNTKLEQEFPVPARPEYGFEALTPLPSPFSLLMGVEMMRARALLALHQTEKALELLRRMEKMSKQDAIQLEILFALMANNKLQEVYGQDSGVEAPHILQATAQFAVSTPVLEEWLQQPAAIADAKKTHLLVELLRRYILAQQFGAATALLTTHADGGNSGLWAEITKPIEELAKSPEQPAALIEVASFVDSHYITPQSSFGGYNANVFQNSALVELLPRCPACAEFETRKKQYSPPFILYKKALDKLQQQGKKTDLEAAALHHLIMCFKGYRNTSCRWDENFTNEGKSWFQRLHKIYPNSSWAKKTPYYY